MDAGFGVGGIVGDGLFVCEEGGDGLNIALGVGDGMFRLALGLVFESGIV